MAITVKINGVSYTPENGQVFNEEYNEKLDSGVVILDDFSQVDFEPFDLVEVTGDTIYGRRFLADTVDEDQTSYSPERYTYTITYFSETKGLERITLPNLSITQSMVAGETHTVWYYFSNYVTYYSPQIKVANLGGTGWHYESRYSIDSTVQTKLNSIDCPEFQWNKPTLREVLDDLLGVANCIAVVKNNIIGFYDITELGNPIDLTKLSHTKRNMTSADYATNLNITMKNGIGNNPVKRTEYIGFRSNDGELTTDNMKIITQRPIDEIISCTMAFTLTNSNTGAIYYRELDITNAIKEKKAWDVLNANGFITDFLPEKCDTHQQANAYYDRGSNIIDGWGKLFKKGLTSNSVIRTIMRCVGYPTIGTLDEITEVRDVYFKLTYNTADEATLNVGKYLPMRHDEISIFDNQENSYIDIKQQSIFEYIKVNRLGSRLKTIYGEYKNETDIPELGDYIGNEILFSRKIQVYDNVLQFEGMLTEHYILRDWFTAVKSRRRSWQLAQKSDALARQDVTKNYAEFGFTQKDDELSYGATDFATYFATGLQVKLNVRPLAYCLVYTYDKDYARYPDYAVGSGYQMDCLANVYGNSLVFSFGFNDNYAVDNYIMKDGSVYTNNIYPYCDSNGEHIRLRVKYLTFIDPADNDFVWLTSGTQVKGTSFEDTRWQAQIDKSRIRPLIIDYNNDYIKVDLITNKIKDNREIEKHVSQFEFCSSTPNIIFGKAFLENQESVLRDGNIDLDGATIKYIFDLAVHQSSELATAPTTEMGDMQAIRPTGRLFLIGTVVNLYYPVYDEINAIWEWDNNIVASETYVYGIFTDYRIEYYWADFTETTTSAFTQYKNNYWIYYSTSATYRMSDTVKKGSLASGATYTLTKLSNNVLRITRSSLPSTPTCWAIVDLSGKLLIGVNGNYTSIYLNMLRTRDSKVYDNNVSQNVVGDMQDGTYEVGSVPEPLPTIYIRRRAGTVSSVINPDVGDLEIDHSGT